jgi:sigma-B regulation protein RsbU (phosphoserine phosphatase)
LPSIKLSAEVASAAAARRFVDAHLAGVNVDVHLAALLVSELVNNVVVHAGTDLELVVAVGEDGARVEVSDGAAVTEAFRELMAAPPTRVDPAATAGRGWMLIARLASDFGLMDRGDAGKTLWFQLPIRPDQPPPAPATTVARSNVDRQEKG